MPAFDLLALDADDTLWFTERLYVDTQARFIDLLAHYHPAEWISERLYQTEMRNLAHYGYGVKAFALSLIETAVELTEGRVTGGDIQQVMGWARAMLDAPVELMPSVAATVPVLAQRYPLMVITKGDLIDQEGKIERSGLGQFFRHVEVVSHKKPATYARILKRLGVEPARFLMVGNSLPSDIFPVLELGGSAVYIPAQTAWIHEMAEPPPPGAPGFHTIEHLGLLPALLDRIEARAP